MSYTVATCNECRQVVILVEINPVRLDWRTRDGDRFEPAGEAPLCRPCGHRATFTVEVHQRARS